MSGYPIFSPIMYKNLGYGIGNTIIACVLLPAIPAPFVKMGRIAPVTLRSSVAPAIAAAPYG
jgi:hypothetical protein